MRIRGPAAGGQATVMFCSRGRPIFVYYSYAKDPLDPFAWISAIRWTRIGDIIR